MAHPKACYFYWKGGDIPARGCRWGDKCKNIHAVGRDIPEILFEERRKWEKRNKELEKRNKELMEQNEKIRAETRSQKRTADDLRRYWTYERKKRRIAEDHNKELEADLRDETKLRKIAEEGWNNEEKLHEAARSRLTN